MPRAVFSNDTFKLFSFAFKKMNRSKLERENVPPECAEKYESKKKSCTWKHWFLRRKPTCKTAKMQFTQCYSEYVKDRIEKGHRFKNTTQAQIKELQAQLEPLMNSGKLTDIEKADSLEKQIQALQSSRGGTKRRRRRYRSSRL